LKLYPKIIDFIKRLRRDSNQLTPFKFMISLKVLISSDFMNIIKQNVSTDLIIFLKHADIKSIIYQIEF